MSLEKIKSLIPHRGPMLLVDEIVEMTDTSIHCRKTFHGDEYFYDGHYPDNPITPGVILCEAAVQTGAILGANVYPTGSGTPVLARIKDSRFKQPVFPGQTVDLYAKFDEVSSGFYFFSGKVMCEGKLAVRLSYVSTLVPAMDGSEPSESNGNGTDIASE